ncbi:unnamed protein product [Adineta steineri]|uniref:Uncharacterized protein n=1 Tax=Adineta steineri TaxID=433720 RepID=A0A815Z2Y0_9BILA|nr:unnamed protein product [Adineta steineri]CAF1673025.1 unnamed protein product [Adineta steineri]
MSSTNNFDINKFSSKDNKYHLPLIYNIDEEGYYYGSYHDHSFQLTGFFQARTSEDMLKQAYESFTMCMEGEKKFPYNIDDIENVVVFDIIKCEHEEEEELADNVKHEGKGFNEIIEALNQ